MLALPAVQEAVARIAAEVDVEATRLAIQRAYQEGTYAALIRVLGAPNPVTGAVTVAATDRKSKWLEEGTGIYGPRRRPIKPKRGRYLVFRVNTGTARSGRQTDGDLVFATQVKGRPASWVMRDAAQLVATRRGARFVNHRTFQG